MNNKMSMFIVIAANTIAASILIISVFIHSQGKDDKHVVEDTLEPSSDPCHCEDEMIELSRVDKTMKLYSPGYPNNYCTDQSCKWIISTREGLSIKLQWNNFNTENNMDKVYIYDGKDDTASLLSICTGSRCGDQVTETNSMQIVFYSDHVATDIGFKATLIAVDSDPCYCSESVFRLENLGESYSLLSPNYPSTYCPNVDCSWTIEAPEGYGLHIIWKEFEVEQGKDHVSIYERDIMLNKCTGRDCESMSAVTTGGELIIRFESDHHNTTDIGFNAVITAVPNCDPFLSIASEIKAISDCEEDMLDVPLGSVSFSALREDGHIPHRATVTLTCNTTEKIEGTVNDKQDQATCEAPRWTELKKCVKVCELDRRNLLLDETLDHLNICTTGEMLELSLIATGTEIVTQKRSLVDNELISNNAFSCDGNQWSPVAPVCHTSGIFLTNEFYSPFDGSSKVLNLPLKPLSHRASAVLKDQRIILMGGYGKLLPQEKHKAQAATTLIDLHRRTVSPGPKLNTARRGASAALYNEMLYLCGGWETEDVPLSSCEVLDQDHWSLLPQAMKLARYELQLIVLGESLYAIGGRGSDKSSVEKVEKFQGEAWVPVASMKAKREAFGVSVFKDTILVCGGDDAELTILGWWLVDAMKTCEQYMPQHDVWKPFASLNFERNYLAMVNYFGTLYAFGGLQDDANKWYFGDATKIESYDTINNRWTWIDNMTYAMEDGYGLTVPFY